MLKTKNLIRYIVMLSSVLLGLFISTKQVTSIDYDVPLLIDFGLLSYSFLGLGLVVFLVGLTFIFKKYRDLLLIAILGPLIYFFSTSILSFYKGSSGISSNKVSYTQVLQKDNKKLFIPVFFDNGSSVLRTSEINKLLNYSTILNSCQTDSIKVIGYSSSLKYKTQSDDKNLDLANQRASVVAKYLNNFKEIKINTHQWKLYDDMYNSTRIRDEQLDGSRDLFLEKMNRRVEVIWLNNKCADN